jgi:hypothetical protein
MRTARAIGQTAASAALVICLLVLIGAHVYGLPFISPIGSTVLSLFSPWLVVVPIVIGASKFGYGARRTRAAHFY